MLLLCVFYFFLEILTHRISFDVLYIQNSLFLKIVVSLMLGCDLAMYTIFLINFYCEMVSISEIQPIQSLWGEFYDFIRQLWYLDNHGRILQMIVLVVRIRTLDCNVTIKQNLLLFEELGKHLWLVLVRLCNWSCQDPGGNLDSINMPLGSVCLV